MCSAMSLIVWEDLVHLVASPLQSIIFPKGTTVEFSFYLELAMRKQLGYMCASFWSLITEILKIAIYFNLLNY